MLDERSPLALYHQLKEKMVDKIRNGEWQPGQKIPSERELCSSYEVSRITVRQALHEIEREGFILRKQGRGTFVSKPKIEQSLERFYTFSEDVNKMGYEAGSLILDFAMVNGITRINKKLGIQEDTDLYMIKRLRTADNDPFAVETSYLPACLFPGMSKKDVSGSGLYNLLKNKYGIYVNEAEETFEAVMTDPYEAEILDIDKKTACILLKRLAYSKGIPVEYCETLIRGDRFIYKISLR